MLIVNPSHPKSTEAITFSCESEKLTVIYIFIHDIVIQIQSLQIMFYKYLHMLTVIRKMLLLLFRLQIINFYNMVVSVILKI